MTKLLAPEDVNKLSCELAGHLIGKLTDQNVITEAVARNCGSHDKISFTFSGNLGSKRMSAVIDEFLLQHEFSSDGDGHGVNLGGGYGTFDVVHPASGKIVQIIFYVDKANRRGDIDVKYFSFN